MAGDFIPGSDVEFQQWLAAFASYVSTNSAALGLVAGDTAGLSSTKTAFDAALTALVAAQAAAQGARAAKDNARTGAETVARGLVRRLQASPTVTDAQRLAMGIPVRDRTPSASPTGTNGASRPVGVVDTSQKLRHEIRFFDENTPTSRAKPAGALGCEIWVQIVENGGAAPADTSACQFLAMDTASPYVAEYEGTHAGKTAHYLLRWLYKGGAKGPLSEVVSATIVG